MNKKKSSFKVFSFYIIIKTPPMNYTLFNKTFRNHFHYAMQKALTSKVRNGKHCAFIVDPNNYNIVSIFVNQKKHAQVINKPPFTIHAEHGAINTFYNKYGHKPKGYIMIVVRTNMSCKFSNSKPCKYCMNDIQNSGICRVIYSYENNIFKFI